MKTIIALLITLSVFSQNERLKKEFEKADSTFNEKNKKYYIIHIRNDSIWQFTTTKHKDEVKMVERIYRQNIELYRRKKVILITKKVKKWE